MTSRAAWCKIAKMNDDKTEFTIFGGRRAMQKCSTNAIGVRDTDMDSSSCVKLLGMTSDRHLSFKGHIFVLHVQGFYMYQLPGNLWPWKMSTGRDMCTHVRICVNVATPLLSVSVSSTRSCWWSSNVSMVLTHHTWVNSSRSDSYKTRAAAKNLPVQPLTHKKTLLTGITVLPDLSCRPSKRLLMFNYL